MSHSSLFPQSTPRLFGLDVHQRTIVIAEATQFGEPIYRETLDHTPAQVKRFFQKMAKESPIFTVYEAGGCGYVLHRQLEGLGVNNLICAPSKIARASGNKVKNDKRDAIMLARLLRNQILTGQKELHDVYIPEIEDEVIREKIRQRAAFKRQAKVTQNQIMGMLRRHGKRYGLTKTAWTKTYRAWLLRVDFGNATLQDIFRVYLDNLSDQEEKVAKCDAAISELCQEWNKAQVVNSLRALRGFQVLNASAIVAEIGCFSRFETASEIMAFIGLTPSESSSGQSVTRGSITKQGNTRVRTLLIEAACNAWRIPKPKKAFFALRPPGILSEVLEHAYKGQCRLYKKYWRLVNQGKSPNVAKTAVARELLGFVWAIGTLMESKLEIQSAWSVA